MRAVLAALMDGREKGEGDTDGMGTTIPDSNTPYAVVNERYVEFVRSGAIRPVLGQVVLVQS